MLASGGGGEGGSRGGGFTTYNMTYMVTDVTNEFQSHLSLAGITHKLPSLIHTEAEAERDGGTARKKKKKKGTSGCEITV